MTTAPTTLPCRKCAQQLHPTWVTCPWCSTPVAAPTKRKKATRRSNGTGGAYKKDGNWAARVTIGWHVIDGKNVPIRKSKCGFKSKTEALKYCAKLQEQPLAPQKNISFEGLYLRWAEKYPERVSKSTMDCYRAAYKHFKPIHHREFSTLVNDDLQHCMDTCPAGKRTKENMKALISLLYKYAMDNDIAIRNRAETLYTGNQEKGTRPAFTSDELSRLQQAVGFVPFAGMVYALCYLGYRPTEMLTLKKTDYDPIQKCFRGGIKTEAGKDRLVTISPKIQPIIDELMTYEGEYIFSIHPDKPMTEAYFRDFCFTPCMDVLEIKNRTPYSCRHTFANLLKAVYGSDTDKAALMGHADASQTKEYQSADYESLRRLTNLL